MHEVEPPGPFRWKADDGVQRERDVRRVLRREKPPLDVYAVKDS